MIFILIPFAILIVWTNRPILKVKAKTWKGTFHEAYLEHRRRSVKSTKVVIGLLILSSIIALRLWYVYEQAIERYHF